MTYRFFQVAAFADREYTGNPAGVVLHDGRLDSTAMQMIARETGLPATAFIVQEQGAWHIRWFTPAVELPLCGHATLAAAWVLLHVMKEPEEALQLHSLSAGTLEVTKKGDAIWLELPRIPATPVDDPSFVQDIPGLEKAKVFQTETNYLAILPNALQVVNFAPSLVAITRLDRAGLIISAPGNEHYDCISRYFAPQKGANEDAVTGSAHCTLAPFWSDQLGKPLILARQASSRGGVLTCKVIGDRVHLSGSCIPFMEGKILC
jgi:predicted PhzF superfamily epimerase YddE/YHI9